MCYNCDYENLIRQSGLEPTIRRMMVFEVVGNSPQPLSVDEVVDTVNRTRPVNRVTVYRILDLLVKKKLVERISTGGRSFLYGIAPNDNHRSHPHFYCKVCGAMECLSPESVNMDMGSLERTYPGVIDRAELRFDGICKNCLKKA